VSQTDRLVRIRKLFGERRVVSRRALLETLEVSPATLKRDIAFLRDNMNTPIVWDREASGYRIAPSETSGAQFELPGMWFNDKEIHALLTMQHLLANLDPGGLLAPHVAPLIERLNKLLGAANNPTDEIRKRVLIVGIGKRSMKLAHFENIGSALLRRKRLLIRYFAAPFDDALLKKGIEVEVALAIHLFDEEHISLGRAARMAGLSVSEMVNLLGRYSIPVIRTTADELEQELADFG